MLVTGAGGFVGSAVVRRLVRGGGEPWDGSAVERVVADLLRPGSAPARLQVLRPGDHWEIERADVYHVGEVREVLRRPRPRAVVNTALSPDVYSGKAVGHAPLATVFAELAALGGERVVPWSAWVLEPGVGLDERRCRAAVSVCTPQGRGGRAAPGPRRRGESTGSISASSTSSGATRGRRACLPYSSPALGAVSRPMSPTGNRCATSTTSTTSPKPSCMLSVRRRARAEPSTTSAPAGRRRCAPTRSRSQRSPEIRRSFASAAARRRIRIFRPSSRIRPARGVLGWQPEHSLEERLRAAAEWWLDGLQRPAVREQRNEELLR